VNVYLLEHYELCLEEAIMDATGGHRRPGIAAAVHGSANCLDHWRDEDGAVTELYEGVLTVEGVRYSWRAALYTDMDGERFVADLREFKPLDWRTQLRIAQ
jgi:hypothetical protein